MGFDRDTQHFLTIIINLRVTSSLSHVVCADKLKRYSILKTGNYNDE